MRPYLLIFLLSQAHFVAPKKSESAEETPRKSLIPLPSKRAIELVGARFLDALIKRGQIEMAKGAFKTQLEVLEKVHPDQYRKYKKMSVDELAADAVMQQAEMAKLQPKTGNPLVDMLNENGIPIASSLKGIEQAIRTQKELETQDPSEQIAKAVLEKFQQQILPGLVANMIAGRNPFKIPQMRQAQASPEQVRAMALATSIPSSHWSAAAEPVRRSPSRQEKEDEDEDTDTDTRNLARRLRDSPRLRHLLRNVEVAAALSPRMRDEPIGRALSDREEERILRAKTQLDGKSALVLGLHDIFNDGSGEEKEELEENSIRRSPLQLPASFVSALEKNEEVKQMLRRLTYSVNDVESAIEPKKLMINPKPQPGYFIPRKLPQRPRKMLPLLIGMDPEEATELRASRRLAPSAAWKKESRVLTNLKNNPNIAPLFMDGRLEEILGGRPMLTEEQKGRRYKPKSIVAYPRLFGTKTVKDALDAKVSQMIEERPVPPLFWTPKGRHTRLRWTGATEKEIPGLGRLPAGRDNVSRRTFYFALVGPYSSRCQHRLLDTRKGSRGVGQHLQDSQLLECRRRGRVQRETHE